MRTRIRCQCQWCSRTVVAALSVHCGSEQLQSVLAIFAFRQLDSAWLEAIQWKANNLYLHHLCSRALACQYYMRVHVSARTPALGAQNLINYTHHTLRPNHDPNPTNRVVSCDSAFAIMIRLRWLYSIIYLFLFRLNAHQRTHFVCGMSRLVHMCIVYVWVNECFTPPMRLRYTLLDFEENVHTKYARNMPRYRFWISDETKDAES